MHFNPDQQNAPAPLATAGGVSQDGVSVVTTSSITSDSDNLKRCSKCHEWKPFEAFNRSSRTKSKLDPLCRKCKSEKAHAYYVANREHMSERSREYRLANREVMSERAKAYYAENREKIRKQQAEKRQTDEHKAYMREWFKSPKGKLNKANRRAVDRGASGSFKPADIEAIRVAQGNRCYLCGKTLIRYHVDHFIPIAKGGTNDPGNLRLACPKCNQSKSAKHPFELGVLI